MKPTKNIAVLIETSRAYGRGLLRGVSRFHREHGTWSISFKPEDRGTRLQRWLKTWHGDGILARIGTPAMAAAVSATASPFIDLRGASRPLGVPGFGCENESICRLAFEHLKERGLRHFAFVGEPVGFHIYDDERSDTFVRIVEGSGAACHVFHHPAQARGRSVGKASSATWPVGSPDCRSRSACWPCTTTAVCRSSRLAGRSIFPCPTKSPCLASTTTNSCATWRFPPCRASIRIASGSGTKRQFCSITWFDQRAQFTRPRHFPPVGVVARQSTDVLTAHDRDVTAAIRFIRQYACQRITVKDVERQVALSRSLLNRRFKQVVGRTPKAEIVRVQIETSRQLLVDTDLPIAEIAALTGFSEAKYFIAVFDRHVGLTPRSFRVKNGRFNGLSD